MAPAGSGRRLRASRPALGALAFPAVVVTGTALLSVLRISGTSSALLRAYVYGDGTDPGLLRQLLTDHQLSGPCLVLRDQVDMPARPFYVYDVATA